MSSSQSCVPSVQPLTSPRTIVLHSERFFVYTALPYRRRSLAGGQWPTPLCCICAAYVLQADVGYYNGLANSLTSLARAIAPTVTGVVFAGSLRLSAPFPFDHHLAFYLLILVGLLPLTLSLRFQRRGQPGA